MKHTKWLILLLMMAVAHVAAQDALTTRYNMAVLDLASGLPHNHVNQIFADSQGFIWVSTYGGGVVRYDGYSFMKPVASRTAEVESNSCRGMAEDGHHRLWVAYDEGTVVIHLQSMEYVTPVCGEGDISRQLSQPSVKVYCDAKGGIWQVTSDSIYRYTFDKNGSIAQMSSCPYKANTPDINLCDIERNGTVWINTDNGLYRLADVGGEGLVRKDLAPAARQLEGLYVTDLLKRDHVVWIATNQGLYAYDQYAGTLKAYRHSADPSSLSHDFATSLALTPEGRLLVGTLRGINIYDEQQRGFIHWSAASPEAPLPSDFINCLLTRDGQVWIGTETAGIVKLSPQPFLMRHYTHDASRRASLSPNPVNAMYVEPDGTLWAGTVEGGLNRRSPDGSFAHWTQQTSGLSHNSVSVLEPDTHGQLWIGTWGGGVNVIPTTGQPMVRHLGLPPDKSAVTGYIGALAYDSRNDALWIGSNDGVFYYDLATQTLSDPFEGNRDVRGCIGAHIDRDGQLWMGCLTGVCIIDLRSGKGGEGFACRRLRNKLDHPTSPVIDKISAFCEAKDGTLWLGSNGYGLYRRVIDPKTAVEAFECMTTDDGLVNNSVKGIVEDEQGRLWITTDNGLSVYDPHARTFNNYTESDGLLCQRFYWNSAVRGSDGTLYLGSLAGLTEVLGGNERTSYPVHLAFTRLEVDNQVVSAVGGSGIIDADIAQAKHIRLHESNKSMVIEFSTLTYAGERQQHYSYRLKGFENDWIPLRPGEHSVRYTSLKPGNYTFEVRYMGEGDDGQPAISIAIGVTPYFWKSWWFVLLTAIAVAAIAAWLYRRRMTALCHQEAEKLLKPIQNALDESDTPERLRQHIQTVLDSQRQLQTSLHRTVEADKEESGRNMTFMERATAVMERHYMNSEFGIDEFAQAIGMSRSQVSKRVKEETGLSMGQFIRGYRLGIAKKMLLENVANRNITEIAYRVGFNDPKYFTRCFNHLYGSSPTAFVEKELSGGQKIEEKGG